MVEYRNLTQNDINIILGFESVEDFNDERRVYLVTNLLEYIDLISYLNDHILTIFFNFLSINDFDCKNFICHKVFAL